MLKRPSSAEALSVKLPFFALGRRNGEGLIPAECPNVKGYALAFTTRIDAGSHLQSGQSPDSELELVFRQSLAKYLDAVERIGLVGVTFDATSERATSITVDELRAMLAS
jgi:hypothetical protein